MWSPCIKVCFCWISDRQLCVGCFRTLEELARWTHYSDAKREAIGTKLSKRRDTYRAAKEGRR